MSAGTKGHAPPRVAPAKKTDLGNAQRLAARYAEIIRYVKATECWFVWQDGRWGVDETGQIDRLARDTVRWMQRDASAMPADSKEQEDAKLEAQKWAVASESASRLASMLALARFEPGIAVTACAFDGNAHELNTPSGIVDLKTGKLRPPDPAAMHSFVTAASFADLKTPAPAWEEFVAKVLPDRASRNYVQKLLGASLVGAPMLGDEIPFLFGLGGTGKGTLMETVVEALGDYARDAPPQLLMAKSGAANNTYDVASLRGKRLVLADEVSGKLDEAALKRLTNTRLAGRQIREREIVFDNVSTLWMVSNHEPRIDGSDPGLRRRIKQIEMNVVLDGPGYVGPMRARFEAEQSGILAWLVRGGIAARRGLKTPEAVERSTADMFDSANPLLQWAEQSCAEDPSAVQTGAELHASYEAWCAARRQRCEYPTHSSKTWAGALQGQLGLVRVKHRNVRGYAGLRLLAPPL